MGGAQEKGMETKRKGKRMDIEGNLIEGKRKRKGRVHEEKDGMT